MMMVHRPRPDLAAPAPKGGKRIHTPVDRLLKEINEMNLEAEDQFEYTLIAAAFHEAGRCVIGAVDGTPPTHVVVYPVEVKCSAVPQWEGRTYGLPQYQGGFSGCLRDNFLEARLIMAGMIAELLFAAKVFRFGTLLEKCASAERHFKAVSAFKICREPMLLYMKTGASVERDLSKHSLIVREIAAKLLHENSIGTSDLQRLLAPVRIPEEAELSCR